MAKIIDDTNLGYLVSKMKAAFWPKTDVVQIGIDNAPASGSTNLVDSDGIYDAVHPAKGSSIPAGGLLPNVKYSLGTLTSSDTVTLANPTDANIVNEYSFTFTVGASNPALPTTGIDWVGNCVSGGLISFTQGNTYEVSIEGGLGIIIEWEA